MLLLVTVNPCSQPPIGSGQMTDRCIDIQQRWGALCVKFYRAQQQISQALLGTEDGGVLSF
jgi:hypothetical protein